MRERREREGGGGRKVVLAESLSYRVTDRHPELGSSRMPPQLHKSSIISDNTDIRHQYCYTIVVYQVHWLLIKAPLWKTA